MLPLEGYRALDFTRFAPGPLATRILADLGMEIIKVEDVAWRGGHQRDILTPADQSPATQSRWAAYNSFARNKKSIALNLKKPEAQQAFHRMAKTADVVVEAFRPGVVKDLRIDYATLSQINPRIIYVSMSGYGQDGPYRDLPGHDPTFAAMSGLSSMCSDAAGNPVTPGFPSADYSGTMMAVVGILTSVLARQKTGRGQFLDLSFTDCSLLWLTHHSANFFRDGITPKRGAPSLNVLKCKDGKFIATRNTEVHFWERFCDVIGRPDFKDIPIVLKANDPRVPPMVEEVQRIFLTKTRDEWFAILKAAGTSVAPVNEVGEAFTNEHFLARGNVWNVEHPTEGTVRQIGFPVKFSDTPAAFQSFAPLLGEHTRALLRQAGYTDADVDIMESAAAIKTWKEDESAQPPSESTAKAPRGPHGSTKR